MRCFRQKLYRKSKHTFCVHFFVTKIVPFMWKKTVELGGLQMTT